jgi:hypothetical protein
MLGGQCTVLSHQRPKIPPRLPLRTVADRATTSAYQPILHSLDEQCVPDLRSCVHSSKQSSAKGCGPDLQEKIEHASLIRKNFADAPPDFALLIIDSESRGISDECRLIASESDPAHGTTPVHRPSSSAPLQSTGCYASSRPSKKAANGAGAGLAYLAIISFSRASNSALHSGEQNCSCGDTAWNHLLHSFHLHSVFGGWRHS